MTRGTGDVAPAEEDVERYFHINRFFTYQELSRMDSI